MAEQLPGIKPVDLRKTLIQPLFYYWLPPVVVTTVILLMSNDLGSSSHTGGWLKWLLSPLALLDPDRLEEINFYLRKLGHLTAYGASGALWLRAFQGHLRYRLRSCLLLTLGLCLLVALMDEGRQALVGSRGSSLLDVALDLAGASLAAFLSVVLQRGRPLNDNPGPLNG